MCLAREGSSPFVGTPIFAVAAPAGEGMFLVSSGGGSEQVFVCFAWSWATPGLLWGVHPSSLAMAPCCYDPMTPPSLAQPKGLSKDD